MLRSWMLAALATAGLLVTGCGVNGKWTLDSVTPDSAKGHFRLAAVTLNSDGSYVAESEYEGKKETSTGKYEYKDGKLTFMPDKGEQRSYDAELIDMGTHLRVKTASEHGDVVAVMKRG